MDPLREAGPEVADLPEEFDARVFEDLLLDLSLKFINLPSDHVDQEIEEAQRRVCECINVDFSALWQWSPDEPDNLSLTHLYRPLGGPPLPDPLDAPGPRPPGRTPSAIRS